MKIKTWLLISYLLVMILPLIAAFGLFYWINDYYKEKNLEEYLNKWLELQGITTVLQDPKWYQFGRTYEDLDKLAGPQLEINLFSGTGLQYYSSHSLLNNVGYFTGSKEIYKNLYEFKEGYYAYTYREPVFHNNELIGFYEIKLPREQWVSAVKERTWMVAAIFIAIFITIFMFVALLVNRKLNKPLQILMTQMQDFAEKQTVSPIFVKNDEIGELAKSFDKMRQEIVSTQEKLKEEQKEKEFMIASISHDLKTPLTSIRTYAEALPNTADTNKSKEYIDVIVDKSDYMKQMIDDLMMYTLLQSAHYEMEFVEVDGGEFFEMLLSGYEPLCEEKNIQLLCDVNVRGTYFVNPQQMLRVMDNLVSNALKYSEGIIQLAAFCRNELPSFLPSFINNYLIKEDGVYIVVYNSGKGIAQEEWANVFKPLYQLDKARTKDSYTGTGLGLSTTKMVIEKHGGNVELVSSDNEGTAIICWLPVGKREEHDKDEMVEG